MMYSDLTREEKIEEIKKLRKNLSRRAKRIKGLGDSVPQFFVKSFESTQKQFAGRYSKMTEEELDKFLRNLRYENTLRSSTVKGAMEIQEKYIPVKEKISTLSKPTQAKIREVFNKIMDETSVSLLDRYRYEVLEIVTNRIFSGEDSEEIIADFIDNFREAYYDGEDFSERFELFISEEQQDFLS